MADDKLRELTPIGITFFSGERPTDEKLEGMMTQVDNAFDSVEDIFGDLFGDSDSPAMWTTNLARDLGDRSRLNPTIMSDIVIDDYDQSLELGKMEHELDLIPVTKVPSDGNGLDYLVSSSDSSVVVNSWVATEEELKEPGQWTIRSGQTEAGLEKNSRKLITHSPSSGGTIRFYRVTTGKGSTYHGARHNVIPSIAQAEDGGPFCDVVLSDATNNIYTITLPTSEKEFNSINAAADSTLSNTVSGLGTGQQYELPSYFFDPSGLNLLADDGFGLPKNIPRNSIQIWDWDTKSMVPGLEVLTCASTQSVRKYQFTAQFNPNYELNPTTGRYVVVTSGTSVYEMLGALQRELIFHKHDGDDLVRQLDHKALMNLRTGTETVSDRSRYYGVSNIDNNHHSMYLHRDGYTVGDVGAGANVMRGDLVIGNTDTGPESITLGEAENHNLLADSYKVAFGMVSEGGELYFDKDLTHNLPESRGNIPQNYTDTAMLIKGAQNDAIPGLYTTVVEGNLRVSSDVVLGTDATNDVLITGDLYVHQSLTLTPWTTAQITGFGGEEGKMAYSSSEKAPVFWNGASWVNLARAGYSAIVGDGISSFGKFNAADHTAIQAAIDEVTALGGGKVLVQKGTYDLYNAGTVTSHTIELKENVVVEGEGEATIIRDSNPLSTYSAPGNVSAVDTIAVELADGVSNAGIKNLTIKEATVGLQVYGDDSSFDLLDLSDNVRSFELLDTADNNYFGFIKTSSYLNNSVNGTNTEAVVKPIGYKGTVQAIDWSNKKDLIQKIKAAAGATGTFTYQDSADSMAGAGRYVITGTGKYVLDVYIPVTVFLGAGGSIAYKADVAGGSVTVGVECYSAAEDPGNGFAYLGNNGGFLLNNAPLTTGWQLAYNAVRDEAVSGTNMLKTGTRFVKLFISVNSNPGGNVYFDALDLAPMSYAAFALYA